MKDVLERQIPIRSQHELTKSSESRNHVKSVLPAGVLSFVAVVFPPLTSCLARACKLLFAVGHFKPSAPSDLQRREHSTDKEPGCLVPSTATSSSSLTTRTIQPVMSFLLTPARRSLPPCTRAFSTTRPAQLARMTLVGRFGTEPEVVERNGSTIIRHVLGTSHGPKDNPSTSWFRITSFVNDSQESRRNFLMGLEKG